MKKTKKELQEICNDRGIKYRKKDTTDQLVELINFREAVKASKAVKAAKSETGPDLSALIKKVGKKVKNLRVETQEFEGKTYYRLVTADNGREVTRGWLRSIIIKLLLNLLLKKRHEIQADKNFARYVAKKGAFKRAVRS